jgi:hypothetical protein
MKHYLPAAALLACLVLGSLVSGTGCNLITGAEQEKTVTASPTTIPVKTTSVTTLPPTTISIRVGDITIIVEPCRDDPERDINLENVNVEKGTLDKNYQSRPSEYIKGEPCFLISGNMTNKSGKRYWVAYHADGFDKSGNQVSNTLDTGPIYGVAQLCFEQTKIENFVLHMTWSENVSVFRLYSQKSDIMFP